MNNYIKVSTLTALVTTLAITQTTPVNAISAPPLNIQVKQVAQWFTGLFDNSQQVASNPFVPLVTISSCNVQLTNPDPTAGVENIYLEQKSINRFRLYSFSPGTSGVNLSIRGFESNNLFQGLCNKPQSQQVIDYSKVVKTSCNLQLFWELNTYVGNNQPDGCPTSSKGKVVSTVEISNSIIKSLDKIYRADGSLAVAIPIVFRRIEPIPEPSFMIGLLAIGLWGTSKAMSKSKE